MSENMLYPQLLHPQSPLESCPAQLKQFFKQLKDQNSLQQLKHGFQPRPMAKQLCTKKIKQNQIYYHCQQCSIDQSLDKMILCADCFVENLHVGHTIEQKIVGQQECSCDCGRGLRVKKSSFCQAHSQGHKSVELAQQDIQKFNQFYLSLFKILSYLESQSQVNIKPVITLISKSLSSLCSNSLHYTRLTTKMLSREITVGQTTINLYRKILQNKEFIELIEQMAGDLQFLLSIGQQFVKLENQGNFILFSFGTLRRELMDSEEFLLGMAKNGVFFTDQLSNYFNAAEYMKDQKQKQALIGQFISYIAQKTDPVQYIDVVCNVLKNDNFDFLKSQKFLNHILNGVLNIFKPVEKANTQEKLPQIQEGGEQKKQEKKQVSAQQKSMLKKSISILAKMIQKKSKRNIKIYEKALDELLSQNETMNNMLENLTQRFLNAELFSDLNSQKYRELFLVLLLIINKLSNNPTKKSELLTKVWKSTIESQKNFYDNLDNIYGIISYLACSYRTFPLLGGRQQIFQKMSEKEQRQALLRSYLFERKQIGKKQLWSQYTQGWLKFSGCGKIVQQLCQYNDAHQTFVYKSKQAYPNGCTRLPIQRSKNWENVRKIDLSYESPNFTESETLLNFFLIVFKQQEFFKVFYEAFSKGMETVQKQPRNLQRWKGKGVGQNYVIILLLIDKLCNGQQNYLIRQQIQKIKNNKDEYRFRFTEIGSEQKIKKLLCVDVPKLNEPKIQQTQVNEQQKSAQQIKKQEILKKSQQKKQKMLNKMKQKQKQMLQKMKNEKSSVYQEEQDHFCLSCKEREKKDNQFVNLVHLSKGNTISQILHADQSKTGMKMLTNLHTIHLNCFKDMKKKSMEFQCPLCKENVNCFLPYRPNRASKLSLEICWNVINAVLVSNFNVYETGCLFEVLLISLIQSLGFTELLSARKSKSIIKLKNKSDLYMIDMLTCIYSFSSEQEREKYKQIYHKLVQKIKKCTKKELQHFQIVIAQALFFRISGQIQIDSSIVEQLSQIIVEEQFNILKNTLIFITEGNSDLISSFEDLSLSKISEFSYKDSPEKRKEEPTSMQQISEKVEQNDSKQTENIEIQAKMQQENKEVQTLPERKSLGINIWTPPKKFVSSNKKNFLSTLSNTTPKCGCESQKIESVCLLCKRLFCDKCEQDKFHQQLHMNNYILLNLQSLKLQVRKNGKNEKQDIYFNEFMIEYKKGDEDGSDSEPEQDDPLNIFAVKKLKKKVVDEQIYLLHLNKFNETVEKFYNIIG